MKRDLQYRHVHLYSSAQYLCVCDPSQHHIISQAVLTFVCQRLSSLSTTRSFLHLGAGLSVGLSGLAAGFAIGIVGDAGVRGTAQQPRLFVGMILILIFAEVLGLYGLIVALILSTK